jgi:hypothetical protein
MTEPSERGPERDRITDPGVPARLAEAADAEQRTLMHSIAVSTAESVVAQARGMDLLAAQHAAAQRLSAAQDAAWAAAHTGDRDDRVAALAAVAAAQADLARVTDAAIEEMRGIAQADRDRLNGLLAHLRRAWTAWEAADIAARGPDRQH